MANLWDCRACGTSTKQGQCVTYIAIKHARLGKKKETQRACRRCNKIGCEAAAAEAVAQAAAEAQIA